MDKAEAIKILKDFHDESAIFSVRTALETLHPELKESEDETIRKAIIYHIQNCDDIIDEHTEKRMVAWLEKQKPIQNINKEDEEVRQYIVRIMEQRDINVPMVQKALAWLEKQGQPRMQNAITINGVEYELIEDDEADECERCALKDQCSTTGDDVLCSIIFGSDISAHHRFEKRK